MLQQNSSNWQLLHYSGNIFQPPGDDKDEMDLLRERIKQLEAQLSHFSSIIGSTLVANSGKTFIFSKILTLASSVENSVKIDPRDSWILDSGATNHMIPISSWFTSYIPCPNNLRVQTIDGTLLIVEGIRTINLHPIGKLEHVLHVPKLFISLVSVQRIASLIPYKIEFDGINAFLFFVIRCKHGRLDWLRSTEVSTTCHYIGTPRTQEHTQQ